MPTWLLLVLLADPQTRAQRPPPPRDTFFTSTLPAAELRNKQAVLETSEGTIVLDLLAEAAPNHVAHFVTQARERAYNGTTFHRVIPMGIVQGGDPLSKDPAQSARYGTGGLNKLRFEPNAEKHTRGAVSAVLVPGNRDSAGNQFFIAVTDQPALDGQYTVFARVVEGINVAQRISTTPAQNSVPQARLEIKTVTIREKPAPLPEPFSSETPQDLSAYRAVIVTSLGDITVEFMPDRAPVHVRQFLRLASSGVYDGTAFHRIVRGFVIQGGHMPTRRELLDERQQSFVRMLQPEFNDTPHDRGILSMARLDDPASASSSFFIVLARTPSLDGKYTVFGRVVGGMDVIEKIEGVALNGEAPVTRIEVSGVRVERGPQPAREARHGRSTGPSLQPMLKGSRDAVLHRLQPIGIHGQLSYDVHYRFADEPDSQMRVARVGGEAIGSALQAGDRVRLDFLVGVVTAVHRLEP